MEGILLTRYALKRLKKMAESNTPKTLRSIMAMPAFLLIYVSLFLLSWTYGFPLVKGQSVAVQAIWLVVTAFVPIVCGVAVMDHLKAPRDRAVQTRLDDFVRERKRKIEEAERFYASAEWLTLRGEVIACSDRVCIACRCLIRKSKDLTVDHIKPRSMFPDLALLSSNLQIMCRRCNSQKGDRLLDALEECESNM